MFRVVMEWEHRRVQEAPTCSDAFVMKMRDGGYAEYATLAQEMGVTWIPWSADESCEQEATVQTDTEMPVAWTPYCDIFGDPAAPPTDPTPTDPNDPYEPNNSRERAFVLEAGNFTGARITDGDVDWFTFHPPTGATVRVTINFVDADGDLDLKMYEGEEQVDSSTSWSGNRETVDATFGGEEPLYVQVFGYGGAQAPYTIDVSFEGGLDFGPPCDDDNETQDTAFDVSAGTFWGLQICANDPEDWYRIPATVGAGTVSIETTGGTGNLSIELYRSSGALVSESSHNGPTEELEMPSGVLYLRVFGTPAEYVLRIVDN
jgi:hypothetical protein